MLTTDPREAFRIDTLRIDVTSGIENNVMEYTGTDIIVVTGFCEGTDDLWTFMPLNNTERFLERILPRGTDDFEVYTNRIQASPLARAALSFWNAGTRSVIVLKIGNTSELDGSNDSNAELIYDRTYTGLTLASELDYVGILTSAEADLDGYVTNFQPQYTLTIGPDNKTLSQPAGSDPFSTQDLVLEYDDGLGGGYVDVEDTEYTIFTPTNQIIMNDEYTTGTFRFTRRTVYDFLDMLATVCAEAMSKGFIVQSMINAEETSVTNLTNNEMLIRKEAWQSYYCLSDKLGWVVNNDKFRFVACPPGRATFLGEGGYPFEYGLGPTLAGLMSILDDDIAVTGRVVRSVRLQLDLTSSEADSLSAKGFVPFGDTVRTRRGYSQEVVPLADQSMAITRSKLQQLHVLRLVRRVTTEVRHAVGEVIGTRGNKLAGILETVLGEYEKRGILKKYSYKIGMAPDDPHKVLVDIQLLPYFSAKIFQVSIVVGPIGG